MLKNLYRLTHIFYATSFTQNYVTIDLYFIFLLIVCTSLLNYIIIYIAIPALMNIWVVSIFSLSVTMLL